MLPRRCLGKIGRVVITGASQSIFLSKKLCGIFLRLFSPLASLSPFLFLTPSPFRGIAFVAPLERRRRKKK